MRTLIAIPLAMALAVASLAIGPTGAGAQSPRGGGAGGGGAGGGDDDVRIVNLNLLHGAFCPPETNGCQAPDRVALLMQQLEAAQCPEVVGLQEVNQNLAEIIDEQLPDTCEGDYDVVFRSKPKTLDTERVLTTLPIKSQKVEKLVGNFRSASRVVLEADIGPLVVVVTHQDGDPEGSAATTGCRRTCPPVCERGTPVFACQTVASAALADSAGGPRAIRVLMGDFNVTPESDRYKNLIADGWVDSHLAAGNTECDPGTAESCTAGRDDASLESLTDPSKRQGERIDFLFVKAPSRCTVAVDDAADGDGDGLGTGIWNGEPTTGGPGGIVWTSDHTGVSADLSCEQG